MIAPVAGSPVVSVVMAAYDGAALIGATLDSLSRQTMPDWEAIVVDDGSSDQTRAIVGSWPDPRVRLIALPVNGGPVRARNRGVAAAHGRYIAALDQDDLCHPERFARQVAYLDASPHVALLATAADVLGADGGIHAARHAAITSPALIAWLLRIGNPLVWSSVMMRADVARALHPFTRPALLYAEDFDLYHRVAAHGAVARLDMALVTYRRHAGGASQRYEDAMLASATRVLAADHRATFGDDAGDSAALVVRHLMHGMPVADRAALARLGGTIAALKADHLSRHHVVPADRRLIEWETGRRWAGVVRAALAAGTIGMADALAARAVLPHLGVEGLAWARLVGGVRRWAA
ncbi:glycosyl transferase family 2 [Sphingomonas sp. Leaf412]|uniref:glycosyltransferase family 2 protein n=1 Tax=Sphingomonas sp. Leaf412 TaxID=1736370 RepID=UPI0006F29272|nr:glycosyltransferase family A protein [Sphingomonas sp. Leaf412]KQT31885.1 glycosyl transferase family 2 [Sphingomonas sp. Leaf412]